MGKRRAESAFEDNPVINGFLEWMDAPEGQQSIEALDLVFDALEHAGVDARQRKIVWADGQRLSIEQSPLCQTSCRLKRIGTLGARIAESGSIRTSVQRSDSGEVVAAGEFGDRLGVA